jgi:hypothetical protein
MAIYSDEPVGGVQQGRHAFFYFLIDCYIQPIVYASGDILITVGLQPTVMKLIISADFYHRSPKLTVIEGLELS